MSPGWRPRPSGRLRPPASADELLSIQARIRQLTEQILPATRGGGMGADTTVDNQELIRVNEAIRVHPVEAVGKTLRGYMTAMKSIL